MCSAPCKDEVLVSGTLMTGKNCIWADSVTTQAAVPQSRNDRPEWSDDQAGRVTTPEAVTEKVRVIKKRDKQN